MENWSKSVFWPRVFFSQKKWGTNKIEYVCICHGHPWVSGQNSIPTFTNYPPPLNRREKHVGEGNTKYNINKKTRLITMRSQPNCFEVVLLCGCFCCCCQNPNLTTTQPKPNLNLVGYDTIITLHPPPHPPQELYFYQL